MHKVHYLGETALHLAAIYGSVEVMKILLSAKCDVNERNFEGSAALHYAVRSFRKQFETKKKQECVRLLLAHGASVNARTNDLWTPIHFACFIQRLRMGEDIEDAIGLIRILLEAGADITKRKESADLIAVLCYCLRRATHREYLDPAARHNREVKWLMDVLELLIEHGVSLETINKDEKHLIPSLSKAVLHGPSDFLCCLLKVPGFKPWMLSTLLKEAVRSVSDGTEKLGHLLDAGASVNTGYDGCLMSCAQSLPSTPQFRNSVENFNMLVPNGAHPCKAPEGCVFDHPDGVCLCGRNMLHTAVQNGNAALVEAILKTDIDPSQPCDHMTNSPRDYPLITALNVSQAHGPSLVQLLLSYGADPTTVLQPPIESSTPSFVKELCPRSIDISAIMLVLALLPIVPLRCQKHQGVECCKTLCVLFSSPLSLQECCRATICSSVRSNRLRRQGLWKAVR